MASPESAGAAVAAVAAREPTPRPKKPGTRNPEPGTRRRAAHLAVVGALLLLAFALRVYRLDGQSFWHDEGLSAAAASLPAAQIVTSSLGQDHPPTYFLLLHFWMRLAGGSDYALRFASVLAATTSLALLWALAARLVRFQQAHLALALATLSPFSLYYGQETRGYALLGTVALLATYCYLRALRGCLWPAAYWAAALLTLATHLAGALVVAVHTLHWAAQRPRSKRWLLLFALCWMLWALWFALLQSGGNILSSIVGPGSLGNGFLSIWVAFTAGDTMDRLGTAAFELPARWPPAAFVVATPLWLAAAAGAVSLWPRSRAHRLLVELILLPPLVGIAISLISRPFVARYALPSALLLAVPAAVGIAASRRALSLSCLVWTVGASAVFGGLYLFDPGQARDDHRAAARLINAEAAEGEAVLAVSPFFLPVLSRYLEPRVPAFGLPAHHGAPPADSEARLAELAPAFGRVWLTTWQEDAWDPQHVVRGWLEAHGYLNRDEGVRGLRIRSYLTSHPVASEVPPTARLAHGQLGDAVRLAGYEMLEKPTPGRLRLTLYWQPLRSLAGTDYTVFVHVVSASSHAWAQKDNRPAYDRFNTGRWRPGMIIADGYDLELLAGTPPGDYWVEVGMYGTYTGEPLADPTTGQDRLRVGPLRLAGNLQPAGGRAARLRFAELELLEATSSGAAAPGGALDVTLLWRAASPPPASYAIALRLRGDGGELVRRNAIPGEGAYPTPAWEPGRLVRQQMRLPLPEAAAPGRYALELGVHVDVTAQPVLPRGGPEPFVKLDDVVIR